MSQSRSELEFLRSSEEAQPLDEDLLRKLQVQKFDPAQPRDPAGVRTGGRWVKVGTTAIDTPEFKAWFGDWTDPKKFSSRARGPVSYAVDGEGRPQVMYHTTRTPGFAAFETGRPSKNSNFAGSYDTTRHAIFFTPSVQEAEAYAAPHGSATMPVYLRAQSPLDLTKGLKGDDFEQLVAAGMDARYARNYIGHWGMFDDENGAQVVKAIRAAGFDSVIFIDENPDTRESFETWAVFDPEQIKSVFNRGTFDARETDISKRDTDGTQPRAPAGTSEGGRWTRVGWEATFSMSDLVGVGNPNMMDLTLPKLQEQVRAFAERLPWSDEANLISRIKFQSLLPPPVGVGEDKHRILNTVFGMASAGRDEQTGALQPRVVYNDYLLRDKRILAAMPNVREHTLIHEIGHCVDYENKVGLEALKLDPKLTWFRESMDGLVSIIKEDKSEAGRNAHNLLDGVTQVWASSKRSEFGHVELTADMYAYLRGANSIRGIPRHAFKRIFPKTIEIYTRAFQNTVRDFEPLEPVMPPPLYKADVNLSAIPGWWQGYTMGPNDELVRLSSRVRKQYNPAQPRWPAGSGDKSGEWKDETVPPAPGTAPVPEGALRVYHYTDDLSAVLATGLQRSKAKGHSYGEPDVVWASARNPGRHKDYVEFYVYPNELGIGGEHRQEKFTPQQIKDREGYGSDVTLLGDMPPERIISYHQEWHDTYRYLTQSPDKIEEVLRGDHDGITEDSFPDEYHAIQVIKRQYTLQGSEVVRKYDPKQPRNPKGMREGGRWVKGLWADQPLNLPLELQHGKGHTPIRGGGAWGGSHTASGWIATAAGEMMGIAKDIEYMSRPMSAEDKRAMRSLATRFLRGIRDDTLGSEEILHHSTEIAPEVMATMKVGDIITRPLMATEGNPGAGYGVRSPDQKWVDDGAGGLRVETTFQRTIPVRFDLPYGTPIIAYNKWRPSDQKEFGEIYMEAITGGKFEILGIERSKGISSAWWDPEITVIKLRPVAIFDPDTKQWLPPKTQLTQKFDPAQPRHPKGVSEGGRWAKTGRGGNLWASALTATEEQKQKLLGLAKGAFKLDMEKDFTPDVLMGVDKPRFDYLKAFVELASHPASGFGEVMKPYQQALEDAKGVREARRLAWVQAWGDKGTNFANEQEAIDYFENVLETTLRFPPPDKPGGNRSLLWVAPITAQTLKELKDAGWGMPRGVDMGMWWHEGLTPGISHAKELVAMYTGFDMLHINAPMFRDLKSLEAACNDDSFLVGSTLKLGLRGAVIHEMVHRRDSQDGREDGKRLWGSDLDAIRGIEWSKRRMTYADYPSVYSMSNANDFVAEVGSAMYLRSTLSPAAIDLYKKLEGPPL